MQQENNSLVEELKNFCTQERERIYGRHRFGISGREIVEEYTLLADSVIRRIYQSAMQKRIVPENIPLAILALGGYGRQELNPYSDIDIMLIYNNSQVSAKQVEPLASQIIAVLWDV